jgi:hypothetical protein
MAGEEGNESWGKGKGWTGEEERKGGGRRSGRKGHKGKVERWKGWSLSCENGRSGGRREGRIGGRGAVGKGRKERRAAGGKGCNL